MNWIRNIILDKVFVGFILKWVDVGLSKLPLNYRKTITGAALLTFGVVLSFFPAYTPFIDPLMAGLGKMPHEILIDVGTVVQVIGIVHKAVKLIINKLSKR